jgi:hypothetical protein
MVRELITQFLKWILPFIYCDFAVFAWYKSGAAPLRTILFLAIISNSLIFLKYNSLSLFFDLFLGFWKKRSKTTRHPSLFSRLIEKYSHWEEKNIIQAEKKGKAMVKSYFIHYPYFFLCLLGAVPFIFYLNTVIVVAARMIKKKHKYGIYFILLGNTFKIIFLTGGIYYFKNLIYFLNNLFS